MKDIIDLIIKIEDILMKTKCQWLIAYEPATKTYNIQIKDK